MTSQMDTVSPAFKNENSIQKMENPKITVQSIHKFKSGIIWNIWIMHVRLSWLMMPIIITGEVPGHSSSSVLTTAPKDKDIFSKTFSFILWP